jgi:hypothetical protein
VDNRCNTEGGQRIGINGGSRHVASRASGAFLFGTSFFLLTLLTVIFLQIRHVITNTHSTTELGSGSRCDASWVPITFSFVLFLTTNFYNSWLCHHSGSQPPNTESSLPKYIVS